MTASVTIRTATPDDRDAILELVRDAFSDDDRDGLEEVDIVVSTWKSDASPPDFELVAIEDTSIVGHVLAARGRLSGREVVAVAPLAVSPPHQGGGIGIALMTEFLRRAEEAELSLVVLLGHPGYYGRVGFEPSGPLDISYRFEDNPNFLVRRLATYDPSYRGDFTYCWEIAIN
jgi:predicted N-acetyltransferase YhbS